MRTTCLGLTLVVAGVVAAAAVFAAVEGRWVGSVGYAAIAALASVSVMRIRRRPRVRRRARPPVEPVVTNLNRR